MDLAPGIRSEQLDTERLRMHYLDSGPADGVPVLLIHGNLSTARFYEPLMASAPDRYRLIAPDMRGFGDTQRVPIDATRGLRDWADDAAGLLAALGIAAPPHLVGWSTGGAAVSHYAMDRPAASITYIDPVSPYGFGGVRRDGAPCFPDWAGSGGGTGNPDFTGRIAAGDRSDESPFSPRNVMNASY
jgi:pimeloyl-ACP methyl ester carboxylesterase